MYKIKKFFSICLMISSIFYFTGCAAKNEKIISQKKIIPLEILYKEAFKNFDQGKNQEALDLFLEVEKNFGYTKWAQKALLFRAFIYYENSKYIESLELLKNYKKLYQGSSDLIYAEYLTAICLYEQINIASKDQTTTYLALDYFKRFLKNYPNSDYSDDLRLKLDLINTQLAGKEMYVARYYQKREKWLAALRRLNEVLIKYETTVYAEEALHRLVEIHYKIGNLDHAKKYASILGYNYNEGDWFKKSYTVITGKEFLNKNSINKKTFLQQIKSLIF